MVSRSTVQATVDARASFIKQGCQIVWTTAAKDRSVAAVQSLDGHHLGVGAVVLDLGLKLAVVLEFYSMRLRHDCFLGSGPINLLAATRAGVMLKGTQVPSGPSRSSSARLRCGASGRTFRSRMRCRGLDDHRILIGIIFVIRGGLR